MISSYPTIFNLGHKAVADLLKSPVLVQEKIDGSQFSFSKDEDGTMYFRSKGATIDPYAPEGMFKAGVNAVMEIRERLTPTLIYRGEYLQKPQHNTLKYIRVPKNYTILFDISTPGENYWGSDAVQAEAERLGFEAVPTLLEGIPTHSDILALLQTKSILGGPKIEGVVIKPLFYDVYGPDKKVLMGKFVSEEFKETHREVWKQGNPGQGDILDRLALQFTTEARWQKAVQHLRELGLLENAPKDIGKLIPEVVKDVQKECTDEIKEILFKWAWKSLNRKLIAGLPEWYKAQLLAQQFEGEVDTKL